MASVPRASVILMTADLLMSAVLPDYLAYGKPSGEALCQNLCRLSVRGEMNHISQPYADIGERVRWHREMVEGTNQGDYAKRAGLKRSALSNWESGYGRVSLDGAIALRRTYGLSLDFIYEGIDETLPMTLRQAWRDRPEVKTSK